jgi:predicted outer membrane repeat protein
MTLTDCSFSGNGAGGGGGIGNQGTMTLTDCSLSGNSAGGYGGGISSTGTMTLTDCSLSGNSAEGGGGIYNRGTLTVTNTTLSGNSAKVSFDRLGLQSPGVGGGIDNSGMLSLIYVTISGSSAAASSGFGGGLPGQGGGIAVSGTGNLEVTSINSIFANSQGGNIYIEPMSGGSFRSLGHNLFSDTPGVPLDSSDLTETDPLLGPLADNGGPTQTMALLPGSPAINAAAAVAGVDTDQRGIPRPQGSAPDIGAFELQPVAEPFVILTPSTSRNLVGTSHAVTATVLGADLFPLAGVPVSFQVIAGPDAGATGTTDPTNGQTDANGRIMFTYTRSGEGTDTIIASVRIPGGATITSSPVMVTWSAVPAAPTPTEVVGAGRSKKGLKAISIIFNEPLNPGSVGNRNLYSLHGGVKRRGKIIYSKNLRVKTISYDSTARGVTITLSKPHKGAIQVTVHGGIMATDGLSSHGDFTAVVK